MGVFVEAGNERACPAYGGVCAVQRTHNKDVTAGRKHYRIVLFERPPGHLHTVLVKSNTPGRSPRNGVNTSAKIKFPEEKIPRGCWPLCFVRGTHGTSTQTQTLPRTCRAEPTMSMSGLNNIYEKSFKKWKKAVGEA